MDNISYHGTNRESAEIIVGFPSNLSISVGKGELGKGFYTGSSLALAAIWARTRHKDQGAVIEFEIPKERFVQLKAHLIKDKVAVFNIWTALKTDHQTDTYTFGYDYIIAPFATMEIAGNQFKFESQKAEAELRLANKKIYPCAS